MYKICTKGVLMRLYYLHRRTETGAWYVTFTDPDTGKLGIRRSTKTASKREAESIAQMWLRDGVPGVEKPSKKEFYTFLMEFWDFDNSEYFREQATMGKEPKRRHSRDMQGIIRRYFPDYFKTTLLSKIDEIALQKFLVHLKIEKKLSASTVNQARNAAFVALKYAKRHRLIKNFDFDAVLRASGRAEERGILEREEVKALFSLPWRDPRSRLICLIASQTGMRSGEIRALRLCDVQKDRIVVEHNWSEADGGLKSTKNGERREVPILPTLHEELTAYIKTYHQLFTLNSLLFPGANGNAPFVERQILKDFYSMLRQIGISDEERKERNIVFHSWRHYCAKNLAQVTNRAIGMAILGHKTSEMFDHYAAHVDKETFAKMGEAIQQGLGTTREEQIVLRFPKEA